MAENQLQEILEAFQKEGIRSLLLKGLSLGSTVYTSPPARPFSDLDILISPSQFHHAKRVLCAMGYVSELDLEDFVLTFTASVVPSQVTVAGQPDTHVSTPVGEVTVIAQCGTGIENGWSLLSIASVSLSDTRIPYPSVSFPHCCTGYHV